MAFILKPLLTYCLSVGDGRYQNVLLRHLFDRSTILKHLYEKYLVKRQGC